MVSASEGPRVSNSSGHNSLVLGRVLQTLCLEYDLLGGPARVYLVPATQTGGVGAPGQWCQQLE